MGGQRSPQEQRLSIAVVEAVASVENIDPLDLSDPLHRVVDPDALDTLFQTDTGTGIFKYSGYTVRVQATGDVSLDSLESE